ncbi:hypothetical protein BASA60_001321 [Batrachochytrium salamandrivorans]|nr:hypothetical protein BASA60_001321 [Batrachochytrium salamandrivorans]
MCTCSTSYFYQSPTSQPGCGSVVSSILTTISILPADSFCHLDTIGCDEALQPPNVVRKAGRPRKVRLRSRGEVDDNDRYACKGCGLLGHNVQTCNRRQPPSALPVDLEEDNQEPFQQLDIGNLNGGSGPKKTRVRNIVCINCGGNHCHKTPCRVPILIELILQWRDFKTHSDFLT